MTASCGVLREAWGIAGSRWIYRICREHHLPIRRQRRPNGLTKGDRQAEKSEKLIQRDFTAAKPNQKFLTDITEIPCMRSELCVRALEKACRGVPAEGAIVHSDRGSQFTSQTFRSAFVGHKLVQGMSGAGRC